MRELGSPVRGGVPRLHGGGRRGGYDRAGRGAARDWRSATTGMLAALAALVLIVAALGPALSVVPLGGVRLVVGGLLLVFGLQWLRKAILRASGHKALHDEDRDLPQGSHRRVRAVRIRRIRFRARLVRVHACPSRASSSRGSKSPSSH